MNPTLSLTLAATLGLSSFAAAQHAPARVADSNPSKPAKQVTPAKIVPAPTVQATPKAEERTTLAVGDKAPTPQLALIIKGDTSFKGFKEGNVYVMEFWATWCGPCRVGMPHLTQLQKDYSDKGVTIIGVSQEETKTVTAFLDKPEWAKKTGYTMAMDKEGATNKMYMKAAGQNGIPTAFVVGSDGVVEWIGHPSSMDEPLAKIVAGEWDREAYAAQFAKEQAAKQAARKIQVELRTARQNEDWTTVIAIYNRELAKTPNNLGLQVQKFQTMIGPMGDSEGYALGWTILKQNRDNFQLLNSIAWYTLDDGSVEDRDIEFALAVAKAANEASGGKDPAILDTLARAYFDSDDLKRALKFQRKAAEFSTEGPMADGILETLKQYETAADPTAG
jgi:thiol-disulfide isomerase/thioredoxin